MQECQLLKAGQDNQLVQVAGISSPSARDERARGSWAALSGSAVNSERSALSPPGRRAGGTHEEAGRPAERVESLRGHFQGAAVRRKGSWLGSAFAFVPSV